MIVTVIIVSPVAIFLSICFIVFMVETNAVTERKTIMRGDQINRSARQTVITFKNIAGSGKTPGKLTQRQVIVQPKTARGVAKMIVPLGKQRWKISHLITAWGDIPRFSN